jgi:hypothetical protein
MLILIKNRSAYLSRFLAAAFLLTQFAVLAEAWASSSSNRVSAVYPANCSDSMALSEPTDMQCPVAVCLQNLTQMEKVASTNSLAGSRMHFIQPLLLIVSASSRSSPVPREQLASAHGSDPPLSIRFCSFQI